MNFRKWKTVWVITESTVPTRGQSICIQVRELLLLRGFKRGLRLRLLWARDSLGKDTKQQC